MKCTLCQNITDSFAIGECDHSFICCFCSFKRRFFDKDMACPLCNKQNTIVFFDTNFIPYSQLIINTPIYSFQELGIRTNNREISDTLTSWISNKCPVCKQVFINTENFKKHLEINQNNNCFYSSNNGLYSFIIPKNLFQSQIEPQLKRSHSNQITRKSLSFEIETDKNKEKKPKKIHDTFNELQTKKLSLNTNLLDSSQKEFSNNCLDEQNYIKEHFKDIYFTLSSCFELYRQKKIDGRALILITLSLMKKCLHSKELVQLEQFMNFPTQKNKLLNSVLIEFCNKDEMTELQSILDNEKKLIKIIKQRSLKINEVVQSKLNSI
ncbi:hypothetical protein EDI_252770 [Entamoeba dispar SAW760]|uniref:RING-type domain-containing protein n=1 Tax=Entamoeba dispar (strain ATCC PRA-260 / SAW760) TaxID=370354 RepID=B0EF82_ENTDS|nr:uncharacterized protein EDI_252770 [Entamoeba dispar SAW760]EDR26812.1 hypothetical protein EDI_252770 [Entamoeba dispar SAW760]|eukprot:EDR26812.1 hypothetical protein EDI_252770 [Entamoeba dispar SAW760]